MNFKSWDEFRGGKNVNQLTELIIKGFQEGNVNRRLSQETVLFLCSYNNVRKDGDRVAHTASQNEIKDAVIMQKDSQDGVKLTELYYYVFPAPI